MKLLQEHSLFYVQTENAKRYTIGDTWTWKPPLWKRLWLALTKRRGSKLLVTSVDRQRGIVFLEEES